MWLWLALSSWAVADEKAPPPAPLHPEVSDQTLLYLNARIALREGRSRDALKLWLMRNTIEDRDEVVSRYDTDFRSITWAALGENGYCQDGLKRDKDGVGLWPVALHNWVVRNRRKNNLGQPNPYQTFKVEQQSRDITIRDVLTTEELKTVRFYRSRCARHRGTMIDADIFPFRPLSDRKTAARLQYYLLAMSKQSLEPGRVRGTSVIDARMFDITLYLTGIEERENRRKARRKAQQGRQLGLSREASDKLRSEVDLYAFPPGSEPARILRACLDWPLAEWLALTPERRKFLFMHAKQFGGDPAKLDRISLGLIDRLIEQNQGAEVVEWIALRADEQVEDPLIWKGERGEQLLTLDKDSGFPERSVIALHRGVHQLEAGDLHASLRSLAYALQNAGESRESEAVQGLARRWLSYVAAQFELDDELLAMLKQNAPRRDYSMILEDLLWNAAFLSDAASFERGMNNQLGRGALGRRLKLLEPLASGDVALFSEQIREGIEERPSETMRFLDQMVQRLETENAEVRSRQLKTLDNLHLLLDPLTAASGNKGRQARVADKLVTRFQAIREGLEGIAQDADARERARAADPDAELFAGAVRLAPSDELPWPFPEVFVPTPSIFEKIEIRPLEWRRNSGELIFGWSIRG